MLIRGFNNSFTTIDQFYHVNAITIINIDMLMVNLDEEGKYAMLTHEPDTHSITLEKDLEIVCDAGKYMNDANGNIIRVPAVIGRAWSSGLDAYGIVIVNYTEKEQTAQIRPPVGSGKELSKINFDTGKSSGIVKDGNGFYKLIVPAHTSAVLK